MSIKTEFILDIKSFQANLEKITAESKKAGGVIATAFADATKDGLQNFKVDSTEINKLVDGYRSAAASTKIFITEQKEVLGALKFAGQGGTKAYSEIEKQIIEAEKDLSKFNSEVDKTGDSAKKSESSFMSSFGQIGKLAASFSLAGLAESAFSGIINAGKQAFDSFKEFDSAISNIGTLEPAFAGQKLSLEEFRDSLNELSKTVPADASDLANATYQAISAGIKGTVQEITDFVGIANKVAVAGQSNTETAVNGITSVLNAYGLQTQEATKVSDTFFAGIKLGKTTFEELNASLSQFLPSAAALNVPLDQNVAALARLTAVGIPTAQAATSLKAAYVLLQKGTGPLNKALASNGQTLQDLQKKLQLPVEQGGGLINVMSDIQSASDKSGISLAELTGSVEALSAIQSLAGNIDKTTASLETFAGVTTEIAGGASEKAFQAAVQSVDNQIALVQSSVQALFNNIFSAVAPLFSKLLQFIGPVIDNINTVLTNTFGYLKDVISSAINSLQPVFDSLAGTFQKVGDIYKSVYDLLVDSFPIIKVVLLASLAPIAAALGSLIITFTTLYNFLSAFLKPIFEVFGEILKSISSLFAATNKDAKGTTDVMKIFGDILSVVADVAGFLGKVLGNLVKFALKPLVDIIKFSVNVIQSIIEWYSKWRKETEESIKSNKFLMDGINGIKKILQQTIGFIKDAIKFVGDLFSALDKSKESAPLKKNAKSIGDIAEAAKNAADKVDNLKKSVEEPVDAPDLIDEKKVDKNLGKVKAKFESLFDFIQGIKDKSATIEFNLEVANIDDSIQNINNEIDRINNEVLGNKVAIETELKLNTQKAMIETEKELALLAKEIESQIADAQNALDAKRKETVEIENGDSKVKQAKYSAQEILKAEIETNNLIDKIRQQASIKTTQIIEKEDKKILDLNKKSLKKQLDNEREQAKFLEDLRNDSIIDEKEKSYAKELTALERKFEEEQSKYAGNNDVLSAIENKFIDDYLSLNQKFQRETKTTAQILAENSLEIANIWNNAFKFETSTDDLEKQRNEIQKNTDELKDQLKGRKISYSDYVDEMNVLAQKESALHQNNSKSILKSIAETVGGTLIAYNTTITAFAEYVKKDTELQNQLILKQQQLLEAENKTKEEKARIQAEIDSITAQSKQNELSVYEQTAAAAKNIFKEQTVAYKAFAIAQATIATYQAANTALASAPPPFNFISAGLTVIAGLANVAKILGVGFKTGGDTGRGNKNEVAGVVHKEEYVVNAEKYKKHRGLIDAMDNNRLGSYFVNEYGDLIKTIANSEIKHNVRPINISKFEKRNEGNNNVDKLSTQVSKLTDTVENMTTQFNAKIGVEVTQNSIIANDHIMLASSKASKKKAIRI